MHSVAQKHIWQTHTPGSLCSPGILLSLSFFPSCSVLLFSLSIFVSSSSSLSLNISLLLLFLPPFTSTQFMHTPPFKSDQVSYLYLQVCSCLRAPCAKFILSSYMISLKAKSLMSSNLGWCLNTLFTILYIIQFETSS